MNHRTNRYDLVIFDFDGTLADSAPWFRSVLADVAKHYRFRMIEEHEEDAFRSLPTVEIMRRLEVPIWKLPLIARKLRRMAARDAHRIGLFDGAEALMSSLVERGVAVAVVSSNAERTVRSILGERLAAQVDRFGCSVSMFGKAPRFRSVVKALGADPGRTIAIGDELRDLDAARKAGLVAGAVGWGFATADALRAARPDHLFLGMDDVLETVIGPATVA